MGVRGASSAWAPHAQIKTKRFDGVVPDLDIEWDGANFRRGGASVEKERLLEDIGSVKPRNWVVLGVHRRKGEALCVVCATEMIVR